MTRKLHEQAAVLCSAYAYFSGDEYDYNLMVAQTLRALNSSRAADELACEALKAATDEFIKLPNDSLGRDAANHWALACSMLRNGEV